jgi:hypothetical protein
MCLGTTTTSPQATNTINWGRGPWDERPPVMMGDPEPSKQTGKNISSTNKKSSLKAPKSQSSKTTGGAY